MIGTSTTHVNPVGTVVVPVTDREAALSSSSGATGFYRDPDGNRFLIVRP